MRDDEATALLRRMFDAAVAAADPELVVPPHLPEPPRGRTVVVGNDEDGHIRALPRS